MTLTSDSHFYNIPINTSHSSVHIPTNVYDLSSPVREDIRRTEILDEFFRQNYESDPALSWQYFGSVTGMLRYYPSMQWKTGNLEMDTIDEGVDLYDCRVRTRATVMSILDTLSNNDLVTLLSYNNNTEDMVPCFKDMLIQATPENVDTFKKSMKEIKTEGVANLTEAFTRAFSLLKTYRETRGCNSDTPCNQLIMLVTDGVPGNLSEVFQTWNWQENNTHIPVRVFTYLLGKEVTKVREIQWMACLNRGYYTHVHTQEEVREQVLKYIPVVARPLVLQEVKHPVVWTHTYADITNPALATWLWEVMNHEKQKSRLEKYLKGKRLGVRINEDAIYIKKLHKDEDVRADPATLNSTLWQEYRLLMNPGPEILALRSALVDHKRGNMRDVPVKLHYDDYRRVTLERRDYFYAPLPGTPFGLAVALPNYGTTWIKVTNLIPRKTSYVTFLELLDKPEWRWSDQYEAYPISDNATIDDDPECGRQTLLHDDYYCNKELMQLLIFDARATNNSFAGDYVIDDPAVRQLAETYKIFLRFVATQSGLTRWHHLVTKEELPDEDDGIEFGDLHRRAVNEPWYKGAIFQNNLDPNSISISVPWEAKSDSIVTASMGIYPQYGGKKAPAAVVGFQMTMEGLYRKFMELTSENEESDMNCNQTWIHCYLLDQNGFIIISEAHNNSGQFMGTEEGAVMNSMVKQGIFNAVDVYDYQAWCEERVRRKIYYF
ncbi:hypothetical protein M0802_014306 [Mischocyttarus mexicanus]|nr:hypothetical protein M0802_014306 [Mischocyttarus mexicanus]